MFMQRRRYCLLLSSHLSKVLKLRSGDNCESQAEFVRKWIIIGVLTEIDKSDRETAQFVLKQLKLAIEEMSDEELNPRVKSEFLKILTPMLNGAQ